MRNSKILIRTYERSAWEPAHGQGSPYEQELQIFISASRNFHLPQPCPRWSSAQCKIQRGRITFLKYCYTSLTLKLSVYYQYYYNATWAAVKTASQWKRINSSVDFKAIFHRQELQELPSIAPSPGTAVPQGNVPRLKWHPCFYRHLKVEGTFIQLLQLSYLFPGKGSLMWIHQYLHSNWMQPSCDFLQRKTADWKN